MIFDRAAWHVESGAHDAIARGFAPIGHYISWLIQRGLHASGTLPTELVEGVMRGEISGEDLADVVDNTLSSDIMSEAGLEFSRWSYAEYLNAYESFAVAAGSSASEMARFVMSHLDRRHGEWEARAKTWSSEPHLSGVHDHSQQLRGIGIVQHTDSIHQREVALRSDNESLSPSMRDLERLIPADATSPPMEVRSRTAVEWRSTSLTRRLENLGVDPLDAVIVTGQGGTGEDTLLVAMYAIPGIHASRLETELRLVIPSVPGSPWRSRDVANITLQWSEGDGLAVTFWAVDGLAFQVAGKASDVMRVAARLIASEQV